MGERSARIRVQPDNRHARGALGGGVRKTFLTNAFGHIAVLRVHGRNGFCLALDHLDRHAPATRRRCVNPARRFCQSSLRSTTASAKEAV